MKSLFSKLIFAGSSLWIGATTPAFSQSLSKFGPAPGYTQSRGIAISDDGKTVIGDVYNITPTGDALFQSFFWTDQQGLTLPHLAYSESVADALSRDGNTALFRITMTDSQTYSILERKNGTTVDFTALTGDRFTHAAGLSGDGSVVVGTLGSQAFVWSATGGIVRLGNLPALTVKSPNSEGAGITSDGKVVVGYGTSNLTTGGVSSFLWTAGTGLRALDETGSPSSLVFDLSDDAQMIVGEKNRQASLWQPTTGFQPLFKPFGDATISNAVAVSGNGAFIIGWANRQNQTDTQTGMLWLPTGEGWTLDALASGLGFDLQNWNALQAYGVSDDGRYLTGSGLYNGVEQAFIWDFGPAGFVAPSPVPETASFGLYGGLALAYLAGIRRWRKIKIRT